MPYTPMKTWGSETLTSSDMNTYLRDNIEYLKGVADGVAFSGVQLTRTAATSISDSSETTITWTTEVLDYGGWWASGTNIVVPAGAIPSGYTTIALAVNARTKFAANGTGARRIKVKKNGTEFGSVSLSGISGETVDLQLAELVTVVATDVLIFTVYQTSGSALDVSQTQISVYRVAPVV